MGVCCGVHVLFVNRPAGKKRDTWFYSASHPGTQSEVRWEVARGEEGGRRRAGGNSIRARLYECMGTMFSAMALSATQRRGWRGRRRSGSRGAGWRDASLCGRITVTAGWKRRPRRRLLEF